MHKKLFSFLKNSRQDSQDIGPVRDPHTNKVLTSNTDKANLINNHLQSVFTPVSPLRLNQLSESAIREGLAKSTLREENIPGTFRPKVPETPQVGILKLLAGLDPSKAAGPDAIKPVVLRFLKDQVAPPPYSKQYFSNQYTLARYLLTGRRLSSLPFSKKATNVTQATTGLSP